VTRPLHELFQHMEWADARAWNAVLSAPATRDDSVIGERFYHIHLVQMAFLYAWSGRPLNLPKQTEFADSMAVANWGRGIHRELAGYIKRVDEQDLDRPMKLPWADYVEKQFGRPAAPVTYEQTMLQVISHSTHHRGQVNARLRELGVEPPFLDFIVWLYFAKPVAEWPSLS
jgi:uncharacterized damage-inducible protein DinB